MSDKKGIFVKADAIGIDIGSVSVKVVVLDSSGNLIEAAYKRFHGRPFQTLKELLEDKFDEYLENPICKPTFALKITPS